jgi:hypothetical protein
VSLARAAEHDPDLAGLRAGLSALTAHVPAALEAAIQVATAHRPICILSPAAGFIAVDDPELLRALYNDPEGRGLWAGPPLSEGLLVRAGVSEAKLQRLLTRHGARLAATP